MARITFTAGRVAKFECPPNKGQAFLWDAAQPGLGLRVTRNGARAYIFQTRVNGKSIRVTIGQPSVWSIAQAQAKARELQLLVDAGHNPVELRREMAAAKEAGQQAARQQEELDAVTVGTAWGEYLQDRCPQWGARHYADHLALARAGGEPVKRGKGVTRAGPLHAFMALPLSQLDSSTVERWAKREGSKRPTQARLALRLLGAFLNWCAEHDSYRAIVQDNPTTGRRVREALGRPQAKHDVLQREQLSAWFVAVQQINNPVIGAALQFLLLTGCRVNEALRLRWDDVDMRWNVIQLHDKVETAGRAIPMTPYVRQLLDALPRRNEWVFSSTRMLRMDAHNIQRRAAKAEQKGASAPVGDVLQTSAAGHISTPNKPHARACATAGIEGLTLHGLRRSFGTLAEWTEPPSGVVAQIMGHKPSAVAERHYRVRSVDMLRMHHERIEAWFLEQAGVRVDDQVSSLHVMTG